MYTGIVLSTRVLKTMLGLSTRVLSGAFRRLLSIYQDRTVL